MFVIQGFYGFICPPFVPRIHNYLILNTSYFLRGKVNGDE
jgi:hypothetical protein